MTLLETQKMLTDDPDFVSLKRFDFSLKKVMDRYPEGCPDHVIASALLVSEEEVPILYEQVVTKLRNLMGVQL